MDFRSIRFAKYTLAFVLLCLSSQLMASLHGIPGYSLNETGSDSCHSCHTQAFFSANNTTISLTGSNTALKGTIQSYNVLMSASSASSGAYGGVNVSAGAGILSAANTETVFINNELVHSNRKASVENAGRYEVSWNFNWQAPNTTGAVSLYVCGLPVDGDGSEKRSFFSADGETACSSLLINVLQPPLAIAGDNQTVPGSSSVTLDASASTDDGVLTYTWTQLAGTSVTLADASQAITQFTAPVQPVSATEELVFRLTVTDTDGLTSSDDISIFVQGARAANSAPVASAGNDQSVNEGVNVLLDASASSDDGAIVSYLWQQVAGVQSVTLDDASLIQPSFNAPLVDTAGDRLEFQLSVTDDMDVTSTDTVTITVNNINQPPLAKITDASGVVISAIANNAEITLYANYSSDPDGAISAYSWRQTAGRLISNAGPANQSAFRFTSADNSTGSIDIELTVTGDQGVMTDSIVITLILDDLPPQISLAATQSVNEGDTIHLDALVSDPNNDLLSVQWQQLNCQTDCLLTSQLIDLPLTDNLAAISVLSPVVAAGESQLLEFELRVTDNKQLSATAITRVTVNDNGITGFPESVVSFQSFNQRPMAVSLVAIDPANSVSIVSLQPLAAGGATDGSNQTETNRPASFPYDLLEIDIQLSDSSIDRPGAVWLTLYFLQPLADSADLYEYLSTYGWVNATAPRDFDYLVFNEANGWREIVEAAEISADRKSVKMLLTDGGPSDNDGRVNGLINNKFGIGLPVVEKNQQANQQPGATGSLHGAVILLAMVMLVLRRFQSAKQAAKR